MESVNTEEIDKESSDDDDDEEDQEDGSGKSGSAYDNGKLDSEDIAGSAPGLLAAAKTSSSPPPTSLRSESPESEVSQSELHSSRPGDTMKEKVASDLTKQNARQHRKYHSKRSAQRSGGRSKGSKAKMDQRIKVDGGGFWE